MFCKSYGTECGTVGRSSFSANARTGPSPSGGRPSGRWSESQWLECGGARKLPSRLEKQFGAVVEGWPPLLAQFALQAASAAAGIEVLCNVMREPRRGSGVFVPWSVSQWVRLYRKHREWFAEPCGFSLPDIHFFIGAFVEFERMSAEERMEFLQSVPPQEMKEAVQAIVEVMTIAMHDAFADMTGAGSDSPADLENLFASMEAQFLMRVWLPCWICHQTTPTQLLRRARSGDLGALTDLLAIDKAIVADHRIAAVIQEAALAPNPARLNRIAAALKRRGRSVKRQQLRMRLASQISALGEAMQYPLTGPQIRRVFNFVAKAAGQGFDSNLPKSDEAFAKAIQRDRGKWRLPGQKSRAQVSG